MADNMSVSQRSCTMSRIRSRGNVSTEMRLLNVFKKHGISGWRRHQPLPGKPDFVFWRHRLIVFVDGCFWHGCSRCYSEPKSNKEYWSKKIARNKLRDREVTRQLRQKKWSVLRIKEHTLKINPHYVAKRIMTVMKPT